MDPIATLLRKLADCISQGTYVPLETDKYELKDNSHSATDWKEVHKTVNAFLNTNGGVVVIGVHEDTGAKKYVFKGYDARNESKVKEIPGKFTGEEGNKLQLEAYFPPFEIREFLDGHLLLLFVEALPADEKYAYLNGKAYERMLTGDHVLSENKIQLHREYKQQIRDARELTVVPQATIDDLDVDKLNQYIYLLNRIKKTETQKASLGEALSFFVRKKMIRENSPTLLGMLTCGRNPEDFVFNKCQVDCYVDQPSKELVARSRKMLRDTVINLMEDAERFVLQNIETGISTERGGQAVYEYPLGLIRESVNNALAHRDYGVDRFITIKVVPKKQLEIRNPGRFKQQLLVVHDANSQHPVFRIVASDPQPNNPRLADVLKVFNKWEGQGIGMATLTDACLNNEIDLPYYLFHSKDELSLVIPSGKLLDGKMEVLFELYGGYIASMLRYTAITEEQKIVLSYIYKSQLANQDRRYTVLLTKDNNHLDAIRSLLQAGLITIHPKSDSINPIYVIESKLFKNDFNEELLQLFGDAFLELGSEYQQVLGAIYQANNFSEDKYPSANKIGDTLWQLQGKKHILEGFENHKRKVRYMVSRLEKSTFILKIADKPNYAINAASAKELFDA